MSTNMRQKYNNEFARAWMIWWGARVYARETIFMVCRRGQGDVCLLLFESIFSVRCCVRKQIRFKRILCRNMSINFHTNYFRDFYRERRTIQTTTSNCPHKTTTTTHHTHATLTLSCLQDQQRQSLNMCVCVRCGAMQNINSVSFDIAQQQISKYALRCCTHQTTAPYQFCGGLNCL